MLLGDIRIKKKNICLYFRLVLTVFLHCPYPTPFKSIQLTRMWQSCHKTISWIDTTKIKILWPTNFHFSLCWLFATSFCCVACKISTTANYFLISCCCCWCHSIFSSGFLCFYFNLVCVRACVRLCIISGRLVNIILGGYFLHLADSKTQYNWIFKYACRLRLLHFFWLCLVTIFYWFRFDSVQRFDFALIFVEVIWLIWLPEWLEFDSKRCHRLCRQAIAFIRLLFFALVIFVPCHMAHSKKAAPLWL